jgi:hypothetical protein
MASRVMKNGHYGNCLLSTGCSITDINIKCFCGRTLPTTIGCAIGRVYCSKCYRDMCSDEGYNPQFSLCLNYRLDKHAIDYDHRMKMDINDVAGYIKNVSYAHFHSDMVGRYQAAAQKLQQMAKWAEAEARAAFWRLNDPGSYHDSESDDSIVARESESNHDSDSYNESDSEIIDLEFVETNNIVEKESNKRLRIDAESKDNVTINNLTFDELEEPPRKRRRLIKKSELENKKR